MNTVASPQSAPAAFVALCGHAWQPRIDAIHAAATAGPRMGRALQQLHAIELTLARLARSGAPPASRAEQAVVALAAALVRLHGQSSPAGQERLRALLAQGLEGTHCLVPLFHMVRTAEMQRSRGFMVHHAGLEDAAPFDLLLERDGGAAELACETVSAEDGRNLHRSAWFSLVDGIDPDLQSWLSAHPGRYLLKMTLPQGLRESPDGSTGGLEALSDLQRRIREMLSRQRRADFDEAAMLRLDPLLLAGAQASELGLMDTLRAQFGPEAQLAVTRSGAGMLVMAARASREDDIGAAARRRMAQASPARFTGTRPGILAMFLEDTDRQEWRALRDGLLLEGETRQFLTRPDAAHLVAVTAASRAELFGATGADAASDGELRFRNQAHPAAKSPALAPAIRSSF
jgi:hypothetical protein